MSAVAASPPRYRFAVLMGVVVAAAVAALWPSIASLVGNWLEIHDYRHGFLIAAVALAWLLRVVHRQDAPAPQSSLTGSLLLTVGLFFWLVALRANSDIALEVLLPPILWLTILAIAGWTVARAAIGPVAYLYFAIPIWEFLLPGLQWMSVTVTEAALAAAGVPAEVSEFSVTIPSGSFEIVEGCSGKRILVIALAVAVVAGVLQHLRGWRLAALAAVGGLLALVGNWIRIFVVIYAGYVTEMRHYLVANEHQSFGNAVVLVLLVVIYLISRLIAKSAPADEPALASSAKAHSGQLPMLKQGVGTTCLLLGVTAALTHAPPALWGYRSFDLGRLPVATGDWEGPLPPLTAWQPRYLEADAQRRAAYRTPGAQIVEVYVNLYREQRNGRELVWYGNTLLAPNHWSRSWPFSIAVLDRGTAPRMVALEAQGPHKQRWLIAYVYKIGAMTTIREPLAQAGYGIQSILRPVPAGVVSLAVQCSQNCQEARAFVQTFWDDMSGPLLGMIPDDSN